MVSTKKMEVMEGEILKEERKIEEVGAKMLEEEEEVKKEVDRIQKNTDILAKTDIHRRRLVQKLAEHRFIFSIIVSLGVILVWRGIWDITAELPVLKESLSALVIGFGIIWFLEKYSDIQ